ncbi:class I adenylate-forming enzyme family protein [soil metagenome]
MTASRMELHGDRLLRCYTDRPSAVDAMFREAVARAGDAPALVDGELRLSYRALDREVERTAAGLAAHGVKAGDRVAVVLSNRAEAALSVLAIARLGAVLVPIGTRLREPEVAYILQNAEAGCLIYEGVFEAEMPRGFPALRFRVDAGTRDVPSFATLRAAAGDAPTVEVDEDDLYGILYTSGTTGQPKGAMLSHLGVVHSVLHWREVLRLGPAERTVLCIPWSHVAGLCGVLLPFLCMGHCVVMMREFKRRDFLALAQRERITHALLVPAMYGLCLLEPDLEHFDLSSWRLGLFGSAPMPEPTIRRFAQVFPGLVMCNAYGATETTSPATVMPPGQGDARLDSIGRVVPCGELRVMDDAGREVAPGEDGELWIAGPMVVSGYWRNEEADRRSFAQGFWRSGDIGSVDAEGFVRIADRQKDMINRGGFKVYPAEVENVLSDLPEVVEAAVVGRVDAMLGEGVVAFLNVRSLADGTPAIDAATVHAFCVQRMADYKVPGAVVIGTEALPRNANGKIQKDPLRALAAALPASPRVAPNAR